MESVMLSTNASLSWRPPSSGLLSVHDVRDDLMLQVRGRAAGPDTL